MVGSLPIARSGLLLDGPLEDVLAVLVEPGERGDRLRKASPFPGALTEEERHEIFRAWRAGDVH